MHRILVKYPIASLCILTAIMLLPNLETLSVSIMEARNFITAREMLTDNNWLLTTMNGEARYQKPPLPTWLTAISASIFGLKSVFGMRLPAVFMLMLVSSFTYLISKEIVGDKLHSIRNGLIALTSFYIVGITIEAPWDIYTHGFMLVAIFCLFRLFQKKENYWKYTLIAGFFIGLSILSKGPVSIYALLIPFLIAYGLTYKYSELKAKSFSFFSVIIIALIVGGWWYLYVRYQDTAIFDAITQKETANWSSYNVRPFYYYWSFFVQSGLWTIPAFISLLYPYLKSRVTHKKAYTFSFLWTLIAVVLLSIIPEKKSRYLMPVLIPLAINIGFYINYIIRAFKTMHDKRETLPVYFNFGLIATIAIGFPILAFLLGINFQQFWVRISITSIISIAIGLFMFFQLSKKNMDSVFNFTVLFFIVLLMLGLPLSNSTTNSNFRPLTELKLDATNQDLNVYAFHHISPEIIWDYGEKIPVIKKDSGTIHFPKEKKFGMLALLIDNQEFEALSSKYHIDKLGNYDLNKQLPDSKSYKARLTSQYYILTKR